MVPGWTLPLPPVLQHDRAFYAQVLVQLLLLLLRLKTRLNLKAMQHVCAFESAGKAASTQWRQMWANRSGHRVGGGERRFDGVAIAAQWV